MGNPQRGPPLRPQKNTWCCYRPHLPIIGLGGKGPAHLSFAQLVSEARQRTQPTGPAKEGPPRRPRQGSKIPTVLHQGIQLPNYQAIQLSNLPSNKASSTPWVFRDAGKRFVLEGKEKTEHINVPEAAGRTERGRTARGEKSPLVPGPHTLISCA